MKTIAAQLVSYLHEPEARSNVRLLGKLLVFSGGIVVLYTIIFLLLMRWEGQEHSFIGGFYWTMVTMSTLGFGDITFYSEAGRLFSVLVLLSGIGLLLVVLPFAFIQFFYAPWLEARVRLRAPRSLPAGTSGHVILCDLDPVGQALVQRLRDRGTPYVVIERDPQHAAELQRDDVEVVTGEPDDVTFWRGLRVEDARMVLVNREDTVNTNIVLTVREVSERVPLAAIAAREESVDVLQLSGASSVLPLKQWLGEQLANRVGSAHAGSNVVGEYEDLVLAELPVRNTPLAGKTLRETKLRQHTGISILGLWERGHLRPVSPDVPLGDSSVAVLMGTRQQIDHLDELLLIYNVNPNPILVVGAGRVGRATVHALMRKNLPVNVLERDTSQSFRLPEGVPLFEGDAADLTLLDKAGIRDALAVVLTTHDDAMNIFLASYCRRLNPDLRIISRVTHERNVEAVHRAGADFALSYTALGVAAVLAEIDQREFSLLGGELDLLSVPVPASLAGRELAESDIGAKTGLIVVAIQRNGETLTNPPADAVLTRDAELVLIGDADQRHAFFRTFGRS